jgi:hypothetical protein
MGSLWKKTKEENGVKIVSVSGEIESDIGINLPAGQKLYCRLVKNEKYVEGGKFPLYYIEAWFPRENPALTQPEGAGGAPGDDDIPF